MERSPPPSDPLTYAGWRSTSASAVTEPAVDPLLDSIGSAKRVLIAGATGFVGRHLLLRLLAQGHRVRGLSRRPDPRRLPSSVEWRAADVTDAESVHGVADTCEVVVQLVGVADERGGQSFESVHVSGTCNLLREAERAGVSRFIYMSSVGARAAGSPFFRTKHAAEEAVRGSSLEHIILRPSVIYGPGDRFTTAIALLLRRLPVYPVLSVGRLRLQPVAIEDVADALAQTVSRQDLTSGTYELAGPERLKFSKIVRIVARALGLRRPVIQLPKAVSSPALWLVSRFDLPTPISAEQLELFRASSVEPLPFRDAVTDYL